MKNVGSKIIASPNINTGLYMKSPIAIKLKIVASDRNVIKEFVTPLAKFKDILKMSLTKTVEL
jgi:hypothetical protein